MTVGAYNVTIVLVSGSLSRMIFFLTQPPVLHIDPAHVTKSLENFIVIKVKQVFNAQQDKKLLVIFFLGISLQLSITVLCLFHL